MIEHGRENVPNTLDRSRKIGEVESIRDENGNPIYSSNAFLSLMGIERESDAEIEWTMRTFLLKIHGGRDSYHKGQARRRLRFSNDPLLKEELDRFSSRLEERATKLRKRREAPEWVDPATDPDPLGRQRTYAEVLEFKNADGTPIYHQSNLYSLSGIFKCPARWTLKEMIDYCAGGRRTEGKFKFIEAVMRMYANNEQVTEYVLDQTEGYSTRLRNHTQIEKIKDIMGAVIYSSKEFSAILRSAPAIFETPGEFSMLQLAKYATSNKTDAKKMRVIDALLKSEKEDIIQYIRDRTKETITDEQDKGMDGLRPFDEVGRYGVKGLGYTSFLNRVANHSSFQHRTGFTLTELFQHIKSVKIIEFDAGNLLNHLYARENDDVRAQIDLLRGNDTPEKRSAVQKPGGNGNVPLDERKILYDKLPRDFYVPVQTLQLVWGIKDRALSKLLHTEGIEQKPSEDDTTINSVNLATVIPRLASIPEYRATVVDMLSVYNGRTGGKIEPAHLGIKV